MLPNKRRSTYTEYGDALFTPGSSYSVTPFSGKKPQNTEIYFISVFQKQIDFRKKVTDIQQSNCVAKMKSAFSLMT